MQNQVPHTQVPPEAVRRERDVPGHPEEPQTISILSIQEGAFGYAHDFSINNPLMAEQINIIHESPQRALFWLCIHTMPGVEFSSDNRYPPPRCHPGTRKLILDMVQNRLRDPPSRQRVFCVEGPAGVGKSALSQSLAESTIADRGHSGASLFLETSSLRASPSTPYKPSRLWTTISYQLATNQPSYARRIQQDIARDPLLVNQSMMHQFRLLIREPIGRDQLLSQSPYSIPIFIDGLDQYHQTDTQEQIIDTILSFVKAYPDAPLTWFISFRPEQHIKETFLRYKDLEGSITTIYLSIESGDALQDVKLFLTEKFGRIQEHYAVAHPWPIEEDFVRLLVVVSGLFILAFTIVCFCADKEVENPVSQLDLVLSTPSFQPVTPANNIIQRDPFHSVHDMYERILKGVQLKIYETTRRILGFLLLPNGFGFWTSDSTTLWSLCNILGIQSHEAYACLRKLVSVLAIPAQEDACRLPLRVLHKSFPQYLTHASTSKELRIDIKEAVADLWHCHIRALREANTSAHWLPDPSKIQMTWSLASNEAGEDSDFRLQFWENARRMFFHHLLPCPAQACPYGAHYDALSDSQDPSLLIQVLGEIDFDKLVDGYAFPDFPHRLIPFLDWLVEMKKEHPLRKRGLVRKVSVGWDHDKARSDLAFRIHVKQHNNDGYITTFKSYAKQELHLPDGVDRTRFFSTLTQPEPFSDLHRELGLRKLTNSISVMKKCRIMMDISNPGQKFYYILPPETAQLGTKRSLHRVFGRFF